MMCFVPFSFGQPVRTCHATHVSCAKIAFTLYHHLRLVRKQHARTRGTVWLYLAPAPSRYLGQIRFQRCYIYLPVRHRKHPSRKRSIHVARRSPGRMDGYQHVSGGRCQDLYPGNSRPSVSWHTVFTLLFVPRRRCLCFFGTAHPRDGSYGRLTACFHARGMLLIRLKKKVRIALGKVMAHDYSQFRSHRNFEFVYLDFFVA